MFFGPFDAVAAASSWPSRKTACFALGFKAGKEPADVDLSSMRHASQADVNILEDGRVFMVVWL